MTTDPMAFMDKMRSLVDAEEAGTLTAEDYQKFNDVTSGKAATETLFAIAATPPRERSTDMFTKTPQAASLEWVGEHLKGIHKVMDKMVNTMEAMVEGNREMSSNFHESMQVSADIQRTLFEATKGLGLDQHLIARAIEVKSYNDSYIKSFHQAQDRADQNEGRIKALVAHLRANHPQSYRTHEPLEANVSRMIVNGEKGTMQADLHLGNLNNERAKSKAEIETLVVQRDKTFRLYDEEKARSEAIVRSCGKWKRRALAAETIVQLQQPAPPSVEDRLETLLRKTYKKRGMAYPEMMTPWGCVDSLLAKLAEARAVKPWNSDAQALEALATEQSVALQDFTKFRKYVLSKFPRAGKVGEDGLTIAYDLLDQLYCVHMAVGK